MSESKSFHRDELYDSTSFVIKKCSSCKNNFVSYRKYTSIQQSCDRCVNIKTKYRNCIDCDIEFRPVFNWSEKCRPCSNINYPEYKVCLQPECRRTFKTKHGSQLKCKRCYNPDLEKRKCRLCSKSFYPPFVTNFECSVCQYETYSARSKF